MDTTQHPALSALGLQLCCGTVTGRHHVAVGKGSQDSFSVMTGERTVAAVVCDGCSSESHSEVGAILMAQKLAHDLVTISESAPDTPAGEMVALGTTFLHKAMSELAVFISGRRDDWQQVVFDHLLFSVVGFVVGPRTSFVFHAGDGWWWMGSQADVQEGVRPVQVLPPKGNQPDYPGYLLLNNDPRRFGLVLDRWMPTEGLQVVGVGTDGLTDLVEKQEEAVPGHQDRVGGIQQFWREDRFYANPDAVRRRLWLCAQEHRRADWAGQQIVKEGAKLLDDTTLVCARRNHA